MADTQQLDPTVGDVEEDAPLVLSPEWIDQVGVALEARDADEIRALVEPLPPADVADLVEALSSEERISLVQLLGDALDAEVLPELDGAVRDEVLEALHPDALIAAVSDLESDDALEVVADLEPDQREELLSRLPEADQVLLRQGLTYPEYTAGRLMQRDLLAIPGFWTVGDTIDFLRASSDLPDDFYDIFVVDPRHQPIGQIALSRILRNKRPVLIADIMETPLIAFTVTMDQEDLAHEFRQKNLTSAPIVGEEDGRLLGVVTIDDLVDVIDEEHEDDILRMAGVSEADLYEDTWDTTKARFRWLFVNLGTGGINGFAFAIIAGVLSGLWFGDPMLGVVIATAMIVNMMVAGFFGVAIPVTLDRFKIDPAVASSVLLTTVTDVVGFFAFLGLAAILLL